MIVTLSNNGVLKIDTEPMARIASFEQDARDKLEAGGVLLGRFISSSKNIVVDRVTVPMFGDVRGRSRFIRGDKMHQKVISNAWNNSDGTCNYLGEWHTHPEKYPEPSRQDYKNWREILTTRTFSSLYLYFVIVGTRETRIWEGNRKTGKIRRLEVK